MAMLFDSLQGACTWLYVQGYRQNNEGVWSKDGRVVTIRKSPAGDGRVSVSATKK